MQLPADIRQLLNDGVAIPAHPLALTAQLKLDERRQRALTRYYVAAGMGGLAVGVHTTQFEIHDPQVGLLEPVLSLAKEEMDRADAQRRQPLVRIAGICGGTAQAVREARLARELGYHAGLLSLVALKDAAEDALIAHCRAVAEVTPLVGFYLQSAAGGPFLPYSFWRRFAEIPAVVAIKIAPFHRYRTIDVVRAVADSGREDIALYTGNDDAIVLDLLTPFRFAVAGRTVERRIVGGLLGHWSVWSKRAAELLEACRAILSAGGAVPAEMLARANQITDCNAAFFDAANLFKGSIAGLHEVLRRQGLLAGIWCLNPAECPGPGQFAEIDRVYRDYPQLNDDTFVSENLDRWLSD